jgi:preprotein translocase subunit YajC
VTLPGTPIGTLTVLAQGGADWFVPLLLVLLIFYFIAIRPASKERKQREAQLAAIKKHDRVVTNAGIHGVVVGLEDDTVVLRVDDKNNVRVRFNRAAIWQVLGAAEEKERSKESAEEPSA